MRQCEQEKLSEISMSFFDCHLPARPDLLHSLEQVF